MRRRAKVDANQAEIVATLRAAGATVQSLATVGGGCPDLLVGWRGTNFLLEVKSVGDLNAEQERWHQSWRGIANVVWSPADALGVIKNER